jgi:hypothetical protein
MRYRPVICLTLAGFLGVAGQAFAVIGTIDNVPAATLLLPYFEVDISGATPAGMNTIFSINNAAATAVLAHVTVWTDQSIPVLDFDIYLTGYDSQSLSLFDVLKNGLLPRTASAGQDPVGTISPKGQWSQDINFASCNGVLPYSNPALNPAFLAHLQAVLQGKPSPTFGTCYGSRKNDNILRGYVTVDTVNACNVLFPSQLATGYDGVLTDQNVLWGDYIHVNTLTNFARGETLVHIESCPTCFVPGDHTFYGRYANGTAIDAREPLPTTMVARYQLNGGGTDFLIWREGGDQASATNYNCSLQGPSQWYPLRAAQVAIFDETEQVVAPEICSRGSNCDVSTAIPNEAQRVHVSTGLHAPFAFGWAYLNLQWGPLPSYGDNFAQMWITNQISPSSDGRFSVGWDAIQLDNANAPARTLP